MRAVTIRYYSEHARVAFLHKGTAYLILVSVFYAGLGQDEDVGAMGGGGRDTGYHARDLPGDTGELS